MLQLEITNHKTPGHTPAKISAENFERILSRAQQIVPEIKKIKNGIIELNFISEEEMQQINKKYRNKNKPTDVLSFSYIENSQAGTSKDSQSVSITVLGEIFICTQIAKKQATHNKLSLFQELAMLFTHGLLHIFGYIHNTDEQEKEMQKMTKKIMSTQK